MGLDARAKAEVSLKGGYWGDGFVCHFSLVLMAVDEHGVIFDLTVLPKGSWGIMKRKWFQGAWGRLVARGRDGSTGAGSSSVYEFKKDVYDRTSMASLAVGDVFDREGYEEYHTLLLKKKGGESDAKTG